MQIEKWTQEQLDDHEKKFPLAGKPEGPYVLKDDDVLCGFYPTEEAAAESKADCELHTALEGEFEEWVQETADKYHVLPSQVNRIIQEYLDS